ncbi:hypothetical protein [Paenibacillus apiarius]|uniref:hypothetical protein n=1 Tax=Paenibacillus apiarius TaxID=46240 RepID=UPI003B3AEB23
MDELAKRGLLAAMRQAFEFGYRMGYADGRWDMASLTYDPTPPSGYYEPEDDNEGNEVTA